MRHLTLVIAALASSTLTAAPAAACGSYRPEPQARLITRHQALDGERWITRAFVGLGRAFTPGPGAGWVTLAPDTFDRTAILEGGRLAAPMTFTLVGPSGSRVVSGDRRVLMTRTLNLGPGTHTAIEIPIGERDEFEIVLVGHVAGAKWIDSVLSPPSEETRRQAARTLAKHGIKGDVIAVETLGALSIITSYDTKVQSTMLTNDTHQGTFPGSVRGAVAIEDSDYVVLEHDGAVRLIELAVQR